MKKSLKLATQIVLALVLTNLVSADSFDKIKQKLSTATCVKLEFRSIIFSDIFDTVDSLQGQAIISKDGRYDINLGSSRYTFDGKTSFSYSEENNQVVLEPGDGSDEQVSFITRLDELYKSTILDSELRYKLVRSDTELRDIPDSMNVWINSEQLTIEIIEYFDVNDELNRIEIESIKLDSVCDSSYFKPVYPESTERIRL